MKDKVIMLDRLRINLLRWSKIAISPRGEEGGRTNGTEEAPEALPSTIMSSRKS